MYSESKEITATDWWALGDTPVRRDSRVTYYVDGQATFMEMCLCFMRATRSIYLANWGMEPDMLLVRGEDLLPEQPEQNARATYIEGLRAQGLQEADINFWLTHRLSVKEVLAYALSKGVEVKVLLWKAKKAFAVYDPQAAHDKLTEMGITCLLDDSAEGILHHQIESLHQKVTVVDNEIAFVGGLDPLIEKEDDFDRWDTPEHPFDTPLRRTKSGKSPHGWHDTHAKITGLAAGDVALNFRQRWNDLIARHHLEQLHIPEQPMPAPVESQSIVQIARTVPKHTYSFDKEAILGITQLYDHAFTNAQQSIYLENQYFWQRAYYGVDISLLGRDSAEMEEHIGQIIEALRRGVTMSIILPDHPNVGRAFSDAALMRLRNEAPEAVKESRLHAFCLATSHFKMEDGLLHYRPIYVHSKAAIIDDTWSTVGSGNLNNRGMHDDTEINVATLDSFLAHGLRLLLQAEHIGLLKPEELAAASRLYREQNLDTQARALAEKAFQQMEEALHDPFQAVQLMRQRAEENLQRYKEREPLVGHLLPYLTAEEAAQHNLNVREDHGWIEEPDAH
ncbi:phospholipase D-like domain-containing protein [Dictyobacter aurantiacus]|uniref:Phospholipase n=1 Tax=Dictyobacter aurantiacus TaxID=1936993 RepID=A0A401ZG45_9CHLR|nr:phospholipase D-like domain-containing protein [Dictyobacter aurantiacus]GCE05832.1 phospholipase [Dictyobacter aurantiacus]